MKPITIRPYTTDDVTVKSVFYDKSTIDFNIDEDPRFIIDVGANIGLVSAYFAHRFPNALIISLEPEESNFEILKLNAKSYKNIVPIQKALWYTNTTINIFSTDEGNGGFVATDKKYNSDTSRNMSENYSLNIQPKNSIVGTITIESIMGDYNIDFLDIVKIDIEGAEKDIFDNCNGWIEKVGLMITELHEWKRPGCVQSFNNIQRYFDKGWKSNDTLYLKKVR